MTGSAGQRRVPSSFFSKYEITIPEGAFQARIAEILSTLDEAIEQTEALIAKTQQIKAGLMYDLFTCGVTPDGQLRRPREEALQLYKESPLGWIPKEWKVSDAATEFDTTSGITLGPHRRPLRNPCPYLRVANVYRDRLELEDIAYLEAHSSEQANRTLSVGDLLVVEGHANPEEIGRCALATLETQGFTFQNHLFRLRARHVAPEFAALWMNGHAVRAYWLRVCSTSSGLNTINRTKLAAVPVIVPAALEQDRICAALAGLSQCMNANREDLTKLRSIKRGLMHDLLTGRVPVPDYAQIADVLRERSVEDSKLEML